MTGQSKPPSRPVAAEVNEVNRAAEVVTGSNRYTPFDVVFSVVSSSPVKAVYERAADIAAMVVAELREQGHLP